MSSVLTEFVGTLVLLSVGLRTSSNLVPICASFIALIYMGNGQLHLSPAVSTMLFAKGVITSTTWVMYVFVQIIAGLVALVIQSTFGV